MHATDDLGRVSTVDRTFRYDTTLHGSSCLARATGTTTVRFTLARAASVRLQIETPTGIAVRTLPAVSLPRAAGSSPGTARCSSARAAYSGTYVAHVFATSSVGTSDLAVQFAFRRG